MPICFSLTWNRILMFCFILFLLFPSLTAQPAQNSFPRAEIRYNPFELSDKVDLKFRNIAYNPYIPSTTEAMWDLQFVYSPSDSLTSGGPLSGLAGITWTGTEFWASSWNSDTLLRIAVDGTLLETFTISGISNIRSLAWDGNLIYTANTSGILRGIDPSTKSVINSISIAGGKNARFAAFDSVADNGNGGFYIGNFGTDIYLINMSGQHLDTIPFATHGRTTIYGAVVDRSSPGSPYLWVFDQPESPSYAVISQLNLPDGTFTGYIRDIDDMLNTGLGAAGGLFIGSGIFPGQITLGGIIQDNNGPDLLFGLDLDYAVRQIDASVVSLFFTPRFTSTPLPHAWFGFNGEIYNSGNASINAMTANLELRGSQGNVVYTDQNGFPATSPLQANTYQFSGWSPSETGVHLAKVKAGTGAQTDEYQSNDSLEVSLPITDSVYSRDDGVVLTGLSIASSPSQTTIMGQNFTLREVDFLTSVTFSLVEPNAGMDIFASIYAVDTLTGQPISGSILANTIIYKTTADDAANGLTITLPLINGPLAMLEGDFFVGVNQPGFKSLSLGMTFDKYTPEKIWVRSDALNSGNWLNIEDLGLPLVFAVRPNFGPCFPNYMSVSVLKTDDDGTGNGTATAFATGASGVYNYQWDDPANQTGQTASQLTGGQAYLVTVTDSNGCVVTTYSDTIQVISSIDDQIMAGIRLMEIFPNPARDEVNIHLTLSSVQELDYQFFTSQGSLLYARASGTGISFQDKLPLKGFPPGVYFLRISTDEGYFYTKILKQ